MSSLVVWLLNMYFSHTELVSWAWRLPFLLAAFGGIIGWFTRRGVPETDLFLETYRLPQSYFDTRHDVAKQLRPTVLIIGIELFSSTLTYLIYVFFITYMTTILHYTIHQALIINIISVILLAFLRPCMGRLSDRIGRRPLLMLGLGACVILVWPYFFLLQQNNMALALLAQLMMTTVASTYVGIDSVTIVEMVPVQWRFTVVSVAYAIAVSIFGGVTPLMATLLFKATHSSYSLALYLMSCALISAIAIYKIRETKPIPK